MQTLDGTIQTIRVSERDEDRKDASAIKATVTIKKGYWSGDVTSEKGVIRINFEDWWKEIHVGDLPVIKRVIEKLEELIKEATI